MKNLHPDAMLERLEWRRDIRNLMGRISADYSVREEGQIYARYWSRREDVCLGVNEGWYVGPDAVADYYQALDEEIMLSAKCVQKDFPEKLEGLTDEALKGVGVMSPKKGKKIVRAVLLKETAIRNISRYRVRSLPAAGALLKPEDREEQQLSLMDE